MMKFGIALLMWMFTLPLNAEVVVGLEIELSPRELSNVVKALDRAANRPAEVQESSIFVEVHKQISIGCPAHKPDAQGQGCRLHFFPKDPTRVGSLTIQLSKSVDRTVLAHVSKQALQEVDSADPNYRDDHLHFGNPFTAKTQGSADATHYFCSPQGDQGKRWWTCFLSVSEIL